MNNISNQTDWINKDQRATVPVYIFVISISIATFTIVLNLVILILYIRHKYKQKKQNRQLMGLDSASTIEHLFYNIIIGLLSYLITVQPYFSHLINAPYFLCIFKYCLIKFLLISIFKANLFIAYGRYHLIKHNKQVKYSILYVFIDKILCTALLFASTFAPLILNWNSFNPNCMCEFYSVLPTSYVVVSNIFCILLKTWTTVMYIYLFRCVKTRVDNNTTIVSCCKDDKVKCIRFHMMIYFIFFLCGVPYLVTSTLEAIGMKDVSEFRKIFSVIMMLELIIWPVLHTYKLKLIEKLYYNKS